jgi:hydrolase
MLSKLLYKVFKLPNLMNMEISTPKNYKATLIFIHGIGVSRLMWSRVEREFKKDCQIIKVDLLGFGDSKASEWLKYSLEDQARSLFLTLFKNNKLINFKPVIIIGHSMGTLVATEFASRYKPLVSELVLISPPIYLRRSNLKEKFLRSSYQTMLNNDQLLATAFKIGKIFYGYTSNMKPHSRQAFAKSLRTAIIKQDTFAKLATLKIPAHIIYGVLDPLIVADNFLPLRDINDKITIESTLAMHQVRYFLAKKAIKRLKTILKK